MNLNLNELLSSNSYPGRGILLGRSADNKKAVMAYFIMGRSVNSRNRIFAETEDGIRTRAFDESKMTDPSLIIYHPVRTVGDTTIVANGDQSDTIRDGLLSGEVFAQSLRRRTFEPDAPNYTPRISGILHGDGSYALSILKSADGDPLPAFEGEPRQVAISAPNAETLAQEMWKNLNEDNKVSLFVRYIDLQTRESETVIINKHQEA